MDWASLAVFFALQLTEFVRTNPGIRDHIAISSGAGKSDWDKVTSVLDSCEDLTTICFDVANGYSESVSVAWRRRVQQGLVW